MFNKILIALSVLMLTQVVGSANMITSDQLATAMGSAGLVTEVGVTDSGGYKVLVTDLVQGTDLTPSQAFAAAATSVAMMMSVDDNHYAVSLIGVATTDNKIHYLEMNQDVAETIATGVQGDEAAGTLLALVIMFNQLPTMG
jgi:hypothetical protein